MKLDLDCVVSNDDRLSNYNVISRNSKNYAMLFDGSSYSLFSNFFVIYRYLSLHRKYKKRKRLLNTLKYSRLFDFKNLFFEKFVYFFKNFSIAEGFKNFDYQNLPKINLLFSINFNHIRKCSFLTLSFPRRRRPFKYSALIGKRFYYVGKPFYRSRFKVKVKNFLKLSKYFRKKFIYFITFLYEIFLLKFLDNKSLYDFKFLLVGLFLGYGRLINEKYNFEHALANGV